MGWYIWWRACPSGSLYLSRALYSWVQWNWVCRERKWKD